MLNKRLRELNFHLFKNLKTLRSLWFVIGLSLTLLVACGTIKIDSFETATKAIQNDFLPKIKIEQVLVSDAAAARYSTDSIKEPLPKIEDFPLYAAQPTNDPKQVYVEIYSSAEKANAQRQDERWLVDVAESFNAKNVTLKSGQVVRVGVRNIASGLAERLISSKTMKPAAFSPSNDLWIEILKSDGVPVKVISPALQINGTGFAVRGDIYQELAKGGEVTFVRLLDAITTGKMSIGYPNPYSSSTALNLLYTILWQAAGHDRDKQPLTVQDLKVPQVSSVFDAFQKQVIVTSVTTLELKDIFVRDQQKMQAFPLDGVAFTALKKLPGFEQVAYIPFGIPHNAPLVGFDWNTPEQQEGLQQFAEFATSESMQKLAFAAPEVLEYVKQKNFPAIPSGEVLKTALTFWKQRKDGGRTVYMMMVIDTSGSMAGDRIKAVKEGLRIATKEINAGNQVGLITFSDRVKNVVNLSPFDALQHKRLLAAIDALEADGNTALYDGAIAGLAPLMERRKADPMGVFRLLLLTDGEVTTGLKFEEVKDLMKFSDVRIYPIAYGEVNQQELKAIATLRESTVQVGTPQNVQNLLKEIFQTNL
ncbi:vWA domain-containing protein [Pseudanabaena yagii]|uniref:VWA domain-containing protein n=1 Tax=Pseudanabaena yagii GIHE-NHR1 TaxID=2722753 RepID=A0ABX1LWX5_9CYAN|nr:vWA domain-containing protein [Pseudanabaena yagii]NMF59728.1 VWA domain-containing protein [Pseudanabaena yagii GIHE-NHR1]